MLREKNFGIYKSNAAFITELDNCENPEITKIIFTKHV